MCEKEGMNAENCRVLLAGYMEKKEITVSQVSKVIGCSIPTTNRILAGKTLPTIDFMKQVGILVELGYETYRKLSDVDKEQISEKIGAISGGILGFGAVTAAVSAAGSVAGLSAAGITSGLVAIGAGGMLGGILTLAAVPIAAGAFGYGIIKGIKYFVSEGELDSDTIDEKWEKKQPNK